MDLNEAIVRRKSVRRFAEKKPDWRDIIECIDATRYAPMAGNIFTPRFILVQDPNKIQSVSEAAQQPFIASAHFLVIMFSEPNKTLNAYKEDAEKFCRQQAGAAIQNFLLKIEEKKLATCWVGYFLEDLIKREFKIPASCVVEAVFPIGYDSHVRGQTPKHRKNIDIDRILFFEKNKNKKMNKVPYLEV